MSKDTQLPAEVLEEIKLNAEAYANKHINGRSQPEIWVIAFNANRAGATEYAIKLHQAEQEVEQLKHWKEEASALLNPILDYGQSKEAGVPLGRSITAVVLERCKQFNGLQAKCERYEKALKEIENVHAYPNVVARKALSGEEEKARDKIAAICLGLAEEVAKDADTAEAYLKKEGVDVEKIKEDAKFIAWLAELAALLHGAAQGQPIKINQEEARKWFDDGMTPYQCFRETWNME